MYWDKNLNFEKKFQKFFHNFFFKFWIFGFKKIWEKIKNSKKKFCTASQNAFKITHAKIQTFLMMGTQKSMLDYLQIHLLRLFSARPCTCINKVLFAENNHYLSRNISKANTANGHTAGDEGGLDHYYPSSPFTWLKYSTRRVVYCK